MFRYLCAKETQSFHMNLSNNVRAGTRRRAYARPAACVRPPGGVLPLTRRSSAHPTACVRATGGVRPPTRRRAYASAAFVHPGGICTPSCVHPCRLPLHYGFYCTKASCRPISLLLCRHRRSRKLFLGCTIKNLKAISWSA